MDGKSIPAGGPYYEHIIEVRLANSIHHTVEGGIR